jgi:transcription elongation factor Elf1
MILKNCPFCGPKGMVHVVPKFHLRQVICFACGASSAWIEPDLVEIVWNRREDTINRFAEYAAKVISETT